MAMTAGNDMRARLPAFQETPAMGFSLVELLIVLAIASILLTMAVPSFRTLIQNLQVTTAVNDLFAAINLARSEAIKRGTRVNLTTVDPEGNWENGWVVFIDNNENLKPDAGDEIIFEHGPARGGITIKPNLNGSALKYLSYNGTGRTRTDASSQTPLVGNFSFIVDGDPKRKIIINFLGRPRACNPATDRDTC
jgi:type IV fimbrial biogenesis protein FimT